LLDVEIYALSIVSVGAFNPMLFSPGWLRHHNLSGEEESQSADVQVIAPPVATFSTDWMTFSATQQTLSVSTAIPENFERLRELAVGIVTVLDDVPVGAIGFNLEAHWKPASEDEWHKLGDALAPKEFWEPELELAGMQSLTVRGVRRDLWSGHVNVTVQPSVRVVGGTYAQVNDHFGLRRVDRQPQGREEFLNPAFLESQNVQPSAENAQSALEILRDEFPMSLGNSEAVLRKLIRVTGVNP
jgi:hypothetical protein